MNYKLLLKTLGGLSIVVGCIVSLPGVFAFWKGYRSADVFFAVAAFTVAVGGIVFWSQRRCLDYLDNRTGFAVVAFCWITVCVIGALPYYLSGSVDTFIDALFEAVSGFTGTGSSVITDVEGLYRPVVLWRSMTQWLGGLGIIVFFIAILPFLGLGVVQLFRAEVSGPSKDRVTPRVRDTAKNLWMLYICFTCVLAILLKKIGGMSSFDALNHAFTAMGTGGFSTRNAGIAYFNSAAVDYILSLFMFIASVNFALHYRLLVQRELGALKDTELRWYVSIISCSILMVFIFLWESSQYSSAAETIRYAVFTVVDMVSCTGFSNANYVMWPQAAHVAIVLLMVMGAMAGSSGGGVKCIRVAAAAKQVLNELKQIVHPRAVLGVKTDKSTIPSKVIGTIWAFLFVYFAVWVTATFLLIAFGVDGESAYSAVISCLSNVGPALNRLGPVKTYASLPDAAKVVLLSCMLLGRLEFFTLLVILTPSYWRK